MVKVRERNVGHVVRKGGNESWRGKGVTARQMFLWKYERFRE